MSCDARKTVVGVPDQVQHKIRAVAGQRSSPDLCFATTSVKIHDVDLKVTQVGHDGTT